MSTLDKAIDLLLADKTFDLTILSWRYLLCAAKRSTSIELANDRRIELACRLRGAALEREIKVGEMDGQIECLTDLDFTIELRGAEMAFDMLGKGNANGQMGKDMAGFLLYNAPGPKGSLAGLPRSVQERALKGSITGVVFYAQDSMAEIARVLSSHSVKNSSIWVGVGASREAKPLCLFYQQDSYGTTTYQWLAKNNPLEVRDAQFVFSDANEKAA